MTKTPKKCNKTITTKTTTLMMTMTMMTTDHKPTKFFTIFLWLLLQRACIYFVLLQSEFQQQHQKQQRRRRNLQLRYFYCKFILSNSLAFKFQRSLAWLVGWLKHHPPTYISIKKFVPHSFPHSPPPPQKEKNAKPFYLMVIMTGRTLISMAFSSLIVAIMLERSL